VYTDSRRVLCDGASDIPGGAALGHPRVWLEIDEKGWTECSYCDRRFVLRGGPPERGLNEIGSGDINPEQGAAHL
jgi:uncharacterized Zn-finger protein